MAKHQVWTAVLVEGKLRQVLGEKADDWGLCVHGRSLWSPTPPCNVVSTFFNITGRPPYCKRRLNAAIKLRLVPRGVARRSRTDRWNLHRAPLTPALSRRERGTDFPRIQADWRSIRPVRGHAVFPPRQLAGVLPSQAVGVGLHPLRQGRLPGGGRVRRTTGRPSDPRSRPS